MRQLSRIPLLLLFAVIPYLVERIAEVISIKYAAPIGGATLAAMEITWYWVVFKTIKEHIIIVNFHEWIFKLSFVAIFLLLLIDIPTNVILKNEYVAAVLIVASILGLLSTYLLAFNFEMLLKSKHRNEEILFIFIKLAIFPLGIWVYQNSLKDWAAGSNLSVRIPDEKFRAN